MDIQKVIFPLYKLRAYLNIEKTPLGLVKVTTIRGTYILDDTSINMPFEDRRLQLIQKYPNDKIYKLKEKVPYLRQLVKYKSGTTFIDFNGSLVKYKKSSKLFTITSHSINNIKEHGNWSIIRVQGIESPFTIGEPLVYNATHVSIMNTSWGPFLYDITSKAHEPYRRKI